MVKISFRQGYDNLRVKHRSPFREDFMKEFDLKQRMSFYLRKNGKVIPNTVEVERIESLFKKYGVPVSKIWDDENNSDTIEA